MHRGRIHPGLVVALTTVLCLCLGPAGRSAAPATEEYLRLRVKQAGGDTLVTAPRALIEDMSKRPTGTTVS